MTHARMLVSAAILLIALTLPAHAQSSPSTLFGDDFHRTTGLGTNWQVTHGGFATDGTYAVSSAPPINGNWAGVIPALGSDDYAVSADIIVPPGSLDSGIAA